MCIRDRPYAGRIYVGLAFVLALIGHERRDVDFAALEPEPAAP